MVHFRFYTQILLLLLWRTPAQNHTPWLESTKLYPEHHFQIIVFKRTCIDTYCGKIFQIVKSSLASQTSPIQSQHLRGQQSNWRPFLCSLFFCLVPQSFGRVHLGKLYLMWEQFNPGKSLCRVRVWTVCNETVSICRNYEDTSTAKIHYGPWN